MTRQRRNEHKCSNHIETENSPNYATIVATKQIYHSPIALAIPGVHILNTYTPPMDKCIAMAGGNAHNLRETG